MVKFSLGNLKGSPSFTRAALLGSFFATLGSVSAQTYIDVYPEVTRQIGGVSELNRSAYFGLSHDGEYFDARVPTEEMYDYLIGDLNIRFGRSLGPIRRVAPLSASNEDPKRPGFADPRYVKQRAEGRLRENSRQMIRDFGDNLDVAGHGRDREFPRFMGSFTSEHSSEGGKHHHLPQNIEAASEYALLAMKYGYDDFTRPRYYEPINEPHWSLWGEHLADWHLMVHELFEEELPDVLVGGPCSSVGYMYQNNYRTWNGFREFIDLTEGKLDFYSFHVYDFLRFENDDYIGNIQSGLPLEGVIDLVNNYTVNQYGKETAIVLSEHGGYVTGKSGKSEQDIQNEIADKYFDRNGDDFETVLKKRSITNGNMVRSAIGNTLVFMDNPHTVIKAVPFILLESFAWDPYYYATAYVMQDFRDRSNWVPTENLMFYQLFKDLKGRRVFAASDNPAIQVRAFAERDELYLVLNNLGATPDQLSIRLPEASTYELQRFGRNRDFTPYLVDERIDNAQSITLAGYETVVLMATYPGPIRERMVINEVPYYADETVVAIAEGETETFSIELPDPYDALYATLRIGFRKDPSASREIDATFNGKTISLPIETNVERYDRGSDFATTRMAHIDADLLKENNKVRISFPDDESGTIGSVVLRVVRKVY
ncbi:MAG: beta-agarase [Verrucomicrobiota bacterium]